MAFSTAIILAAGLGTRMRSTRPKVLHPLAGQPMLRQLLGSAAPVFDRIVVVVGPGMAAVEAVAAPHPTVIQHERRGTAHAALAAVSFLRDAAAAGGEATILYGDNPLITADTMRALRDDRRARGAALSLVAMRPSDPAGYGRVVLGADGAVARVVEHADASASERGIGLCNAGVVTAAAADLLRWLEAVRPDNSRGEYYLTDVVALARAEGARVAAFEAPADELRGINSRAELARAEAILQDRLRARAMAAGVTLVAPETVFLSADTALASDVLVEPHVVFAPGVTVASGARIRAFSHLEGCDVACGAVIGPYARLRPGTSVGAHAHVGNFVELKATALGEGAKANHLAYLGDSDIGAGTNVGAGTITCNYDGYAKHRTTIGAGAFIGSDTVLVAPVTVGDGALIAAGSVVTEDVPADAMAFGRARQANRNGAAAAFRQRRQRGE